MRCATINRKTAETDVKLTLNLDGTGKAEIDTGIGFMDHMLTLLAVHGRFDLAVTCVGDTYVDDHHSTEDIGIALGQAFAQAIGDKRGIRRYGFMILPMDETLIQSEVQIAEALEAARAAGDGTSDGESDVAGDDAGGPVGEGEGGNAGNEADKDALILSAVDISGRDLLAYGLDIPTQKVGTFDTELVEEFWLGFVRNANVTLHIVQLAGKNSHHIIEGCFKCVARALAQAVAIDERAAGEVPSSKGVL